jgi:ankyrin repeat protein
MLKFLALCLSLPALLAQNTSQDQIRTAASRSVAILQRGTNSFYKTQDCFSCHDHGLPMLAFRVARERGVPVDETAARAVAAKGLLATPNLSSIDHAVQDLSIIDPAVSEGWALLAADAAGVRPNLVTAIYARRIANWQRADGHWVTGDARPPQSSSVFTATAVASRALLLYMPVQLRKETDSRMLRAKGWLLSAQPQSTEDYTFRLLGVNWTGGTAEECARAARDLLALQRPNGGWAEIPHLEPDAYSTGEALVALHEAGGIPVTDPSWKKGLEYLLTTQDDGGSWHVRTRMVSPAPVSPPFVETGFPHGKDQFLSTSATCWAAMALMLALPKAANSTAPLPLPALEPKDAKPWMATLMFGSTAELQAQLDSGLDPNSKTADGTTLLMMAAHDADKVKLLIGHGADVRAKARNGYTALMVATTYVGTSESVKLLLENGAEARPGTGVMYNASPYFLAAFTGDRANMALLLAKNADPNRKMNLLGMFPSSPLFGAVGFGDPEVVRALVEGGADIREKDQDGMTALHWAVVDNHADAARALVEKGADVNTVDRFGYTPLLYAATIDFGNADTVEPLLRGGADPNIKNKAGKTPLDEAQDYPYIRAALEKPGAEK